ncbi:MAG: hypothetical protein L6R36_006811 [Xanthoria steineri]|nr:MAG: hypothetical protein L6R36_006811 [Xanthoria steineri]
MLNFLGLPREIRDKIYGLVLLHQEPIHPLRLQDKISVGLLGANKTVQREGSSMLYARNRFAFYWSTNDEIASFLELIGQNNRDHIRHIYIEFPSFRCLEIGKITLEDESADFLAIFESSCPNLRTLRTTRPSMEDDLRAQDSEIVTEALELVNTHFKTITSLQEIIVEVFEDGPSDHIRERMKSHGWTIDMAARAVVGWDSDRDFSDYGFDNHDSGPNDDDNDSYDIDNDSDFWRRAGD